MGGDAGRNGRPGRRGPVVWLLPVTVAALGLRQPSDVHHGLAGARLEVRSAVLTAAFATRPARFPGGAPSGGAMPTEIWIKQPQQVLPTEEARKESQQQAVSFVLTGTADGHSGLC
jgi:hypothetical protein